MEGEDAMAGNFPGKRVGGGTHPDGADLKERGERVTDDHVVGGCCACVLETDEVFDVGAWLDEVVWAEAYQTKSLKLMSKKQYLLSQAKPHPT